MKNKNLLITYGPELMIDLQGCDVSVFSKENITLYLIGLCELIDMKRYGEPMFWQDNSETPHLKGVSVMQFITTSNIVIHSLDFLQTVLINIFSCKDFDYTAAVDFSKEFFNAEYVDCEIKKRKTRAFDNPKVELRKHNRLDLGVFAKEKIFKGEIAAVFDGKIYTANKASLLPYEPANNIRDFAIQFAKNKYRDSNGIAKHINHSCDPNCGIREKLCIAAMRDIDKDEEITWDYDMSENSDWVMMCSCGNSNCRKVIKGYRFLSEKIKKKYSDHVSEWLLE